MFINWILSATCRKFRKPLLPQSRVWTCCCADDPIWPGRPCRVSCLRRTPRRWSIPLRTPPSWRSGRSLGGIQDLLEIYLFSVLAWLICSSKTLLNESNLRKFWKINIVIGIGIEDWLIWDKDRVDAVTTFSYIYIIAHYGDLHADTLTQEHPNLLVTCHSRSFLSQLSCLHVTLITMCITKSVKEGVFG